LVATGNNLIHAAHATGLLSRNNILHFLSCFCQEESRFTNEKVSCQSIQ